MYGVLYALSPELFPTKDRGTGNAIVATANRIFGIMVGSFVVHGSASCYSLIYRTGPDEPHDICANLDFGSYLHRHWFYCSLATI